MTPKTMTAAGSMTKLKSESVDYSLAEEVRRRVSIVEVIRERLTLVPEERDHVGRCPFHRDEGASFHVSAERGFFYCFRCQASGNVISFLQLLDGVTFHEAVRRLARRVVTPREQTEKSGAPSR